MGKINTKRLAVIAFLIALEIVLTRFCSINTPIVRIGFGFLPIAMMAMLYGPLYAGIGAALADFLGASIFVGSYFPGFTLTAFLGGVIYGFFLYRRPESLTRIAVAVFIIILTLHLGLNTVWLWMITGKGIMAILPARLLQNAVMLPVQIITIYGAGKKLITGALVAQRF